MKESVYNGIRVTSISDVKIFAPSSLPARGTSAVTIMVEEIEKRTGIRVEVVDTLSTDSLPLIVVQYADHQSAETIGREGFKITTTQHDRFTITIEGADDRGVLYGVGKLLRLLYMNESRIQAPCSISICESPRFVLRGHQLGYRPKTNAYDAWSPEIYSQYIRELALFGANSIEIMPPITDDDRTSPHMKYDPLFMMQHVAEVCYEMDLDVWIWYPNMGSEDNWYPASGNDEEFMKPDYLEGQLAERDEIFGSLKRVDHVFVPGGDPGALSAQDLFDFMALQAEVLHKHHPNAKLWVSPQAFNPTDEWLNVFFDNIRKEPKWLSGVVFGPWEKHSLPELRKLVPESIAIRSYPDITHSLGCQYPVPNWDTAFAMTLNRECINPRPVAQKQIHNSCMNEGIVGSLSYSEGINDDVNKFIWSGQDWCPDTPVLETLKDFARFFIGPEFEDGVSQGLLALERNFDGPVAINTNIQVTLQQWLAMESAADDKVRNNYRFEQGLLRANYDAYIQRRWIHETELERKAMDVLAQAGELGTLRVMEMAEAILNKRFTEPVGVEYKLKCEELADRLFDHIGAQLTVEKHQAIGVTRGAFMDGIDLPMNDMAFLINSFNVIRQMSDEQQRLSSLNDKIIKRTNPGVGGYYDNFALNSSLSKVEFTHDWTEDPGFLKTALLRHNPSILHAAEGGGKYGKLCKEVLDQILPGLTSPPLAWVTYLNSYYSAPIKVTYDQLDRHAAYRIKVMGLWGGKVRMLVNGTYVDDVNVKYRGLMDEYIITPNMIPEGKMEVVWVNEESGIGPYINELWVIKQ